MGIERECKLPLNAQTAARAEIVSRLQGAGGRKLGKVFEQNWCFDRGGALRARREVLRLRVLDRGAGGLVTFKRPAAEGAYKTREELETEVSDAESARAVFLALGYAPAFYYEKYRETWEIAGARAELDTLPGIGDFLEIEAADDAALDRHLAALGLDRAANLKCSYAALWEEYCRLHGGPPEAMRFPE